MSKREYLRIGEIVRAHGVRGDVKALPLTDDIARFSGMQSCYLERRGGYEPVALSNVRLQPDAIIVHLSGVETPEDAGRLVHAFLCVDRAHAAKLPPDTYFVAELIGCEVTDTEGNAYGKVTDVLETGANDVYEIDGGKLMVPALKRVLHSVDIDGARIVLDAQVLREVGLFED